MKKTNSGKRKSIREKMMVRIITPTVIGLVIAGILISILSGVQIQQLENQIIESKSRNAAYQISEYFTKYMEVSRQLGADYELVQMFEEVKAGSEIAKAQQYASVMETMTNMHNTDPENILVSWAADIDSSQCIEDSGYVSAIGEWDITTRSWYEQVVSEKATVVTEPYENSSTGELVSSIITPVLNGSGEITGVAALDLSLQAVVDMMEEHKLGNTGFLMLLTKDGTIMYAEDDSILHTSIMDLGITEKVKEAFQAKECGNYVYQYAGRKNYGYMEQAGESQWIVLSGMPNREYNSAYYKVMGAIFVLFAAVLVILVFLISQIAKGIVKPVRELKEVSEKIAEGELDVALDISSDDEIGEVAAAIDKTVVRLKDYIKYIDEIAEILDEIAKGNLVYTLKQDYAGEFGKIKLALENISVTLKTTIQRIDTTALQVSSGANQIAGAAQSLADGSVSQAGAVEELMATITSITTQVEKNAGYAKEAAAGAARVKENIESSNQGMLQVVSAMEEINECSNSIGKIIANIEEIADQTSLLSLNASIEAARAGELGKGFAVVANEVGNLSQESVEAVQTSTELIQNSLVSVKRGVDLVKEAAGRLSESVKGVLGLADKMDAMAVATDRQMESLEEIEKGIDQIASVVTDNSAMAEESAASSEELSAQAAALSEMISVFHIE